MIIDKERKLESKARRNLKSGFQSCRNTIEKVCVTNNCMSNGKSSKLYCCTIISAAASDARCLLATDPSLYVSGFFERRKLGEGRTKA